jgi:hypothetical protein
MMIIGCDFHTRYQQIAMAEDSTGELLLVCPVFSCFSERQHERHQILLFLSGQLGAKDQIEKLD